MKRIGVITLAFVAISALGGMTADSASAWCRHVKPGELSVYSEHSWWWGCKGTAGTNGYVKTVTSVGLKIAGDPALCYRVYPATAPSRWKDSVCSKLQLPEEVDKGGYVKIEETKGEEEEDKKEGQLLSVLTEEAVSELVYKGTAKEVTLETTGKKTLKCNKEAKTEDTFSEDDQTHAGSGTAKLDLSGCREGEVACRSETSTGVKDPVETILASLTLHLIGARTGEKALVAVLMGKIVPVGEGANLVFNCGGVKHELKGILQCSMTPTLKEVAAEGAVEILCNQKEGKPEAFTCEEAKGLCEKLAAEPLLANFVGKFETTGVSLHLTGSFNKMTFIED